MMRKSFQGIVQTKLKFHPLPQAETRQSNKVVFLITSVAGVSSHCGELRNKNLQGGVVVKKKDEVFKKGGEKKKVSDLSFKYRAGLNFIYLHFRCLTLDQKVS